MDQPNKRGLRLLGVIAAAFALLIAAACGGGDPLSSNDTAAQADTIVVGSANFPESQILAEIYAQGLQAAGIQARTHLDIGARETYLKALQDGSINAIPDYAGNLLLYFDGEATAATTDEIMAALPAALPEELTVLAAAQAENKDSLNVTAELAAAHDLVTIGDLSAISDLKVAANPEFRTRSYGLPGMAAKYAVEVDEKNFSPINDGGGEATLRSLLDGQVHVADIYSTTPSILENDLVTLEDPEQLFIAQNVVPILRTDVATDEVVEVLNAISAKLTTQGLLELNTLNQGAQKLEPREVAAQWLTEQGLD